MSPRDRLVRRVPAEFPGIVLDLRAKLGWSRQRLAEELGIDVSTLKRWEHGDVTPRGSMWRRLELLAAHADGQDMECPTCARLRCLFKEANARKRAFRSGVFAIEAARRQIGRELEVMRLKERARREKGVHGRTAEEAEDGRGAAPPSAGAPRAD